MTLFIVIFSLFSFLGNTFAQPQIKQALPKKTVACNNKIRFM